MELASLILVGLLWEVLGFAGLYILVTRTDALEYYSSKQGFWWALGLGPLLLIVAIALAWNSRR